MPAYIILATLAAPALVQLGRASPRGAHAWSCGGDRLPTSHHRFRLPATWPHRSPTRRYWQTSWAAVIKGAGLFIIPVLFAYQPGLLYLASPFENTITIASIIVGIVAASGAFEGFLFDRLSLLERFVLGIGAAVAPVRPQPCGHRRRLRDLRQRRAGASAVRQISPFQTGRNRLTHYPPHPRQSHRRIRAMRNYIIASVLASTLMATTAIAQDRASVVIGSSSVGGSYYLYAGRVSSTFINGPIRDPPGDRADHARFSVEERPPCWPPVGSTSVFPQWRRCL